MVSRISRYRGLTEAVVDDARRHTVASTGLRPPPAATGTFQHVVGESDRLDLLAYRYYQQPRKWWRICDANPAFLSPVDLLGQGPLVTARFPLALPDAGPPPWAAAARALAAEPGVRGLRFVDDVRVTPEPQTIDGHQVLVNVERHEYAVVISYNALVRDVGDLAALLSAAGFVPALAQPIGQVGKKITIPPDVVA